MTNTAKVDLGAALERCSGSLDLLRQVVSETLQKAKLDQLPQIRQSITNGDHHTAHFHSHSIKGASATIGFEGLSAVAKELDDLVRTGTVEGCLPLVDRLDAELATSLEYWAAHETAMASALERCSEDQELFYEIAKEMSVDVLPEQLSALAAAITAANPVQIHASAVQLRDAAETVGASHLIHLLNPIIDAAAGGSAGGCAEGLESVQDEAAKVAVFWGAVEADE